MGKYPLINHNKQKIVIGSLV